LDLSPVIKVNNENRKSYILLIGAVLAASVIIIVAVIGVSIAMYHFTGIDATEATLDNYNNAQWEQVVFTEYHPVHDSQGSWDGYYVSMDGRWFYTYSKVAYQNVNLELFQDYDVLSYKIELSGFPDNAWGMKEVVAVVRNPTGEAGTS